MCMLRNLCSDGSIAERAEHMWELDHNTRGQHGARLYEILCVVSGIAPNGPYFYSTILDHMNWFL